LTQEHIVIIGNGIAGVTAARHIRKLSDKKLTIISSESEYFFSRTALMYVYMGHMKWQHLKPYEDHFWRKNNFNLVHDHVINIFPEQHQIELRSKRKIHFDQLIIATGSKPNKFGWPGENAKGVQGLYSKQDLELLEKNAPDNKTCRRAVIVGGGLIGVELAEMLHTRKIPVTFLVRESNFWNNVLPDEEAKMLNKHIKSHGIDLRLNTNLEKILVDENDRVYAVKIKESDEIINCDLVGLTAGVSPNIEFVKNSMIETNRGILVNRYLQTNYKHIYAIGDCAEQRENIGYRKPIEAVWYTGRMMGETVAQTICGKPMRYNPGHWFNSAKFFEIEYQTYGWVFNQPKEGHEHFFWKHPEKDICIHINYEKRSRKFIGINTFGIRMRHAFFNQCLDASATVDDVVKHLHLANFDPELYKTYEKSIQQAFKTQQI